MEEVLDKDLLQEGKDLIYDGINRLNNKNYDLAKSKFLEAQKFFTVAKSPKYISVCMSLASFVCYLIDTNNYKIALANLHDAIYMADFSKSTTAKLVAELVQGNINFGEHNCDLALIHYKNAQELAKIEDEFLMSDYIEKHINSAEQGNSFSIKNDPLVSLVKIGRSITALTDINILLKVIAEETKNAIQADRCTVFIYDKEKNELWSKVALGMESQEIRFPADKGLAGYVVQTGESLNIVDAYSDSRFNKDVDIKT